MPGRLYTILLYLLALMLQATPCAGRSISQQLLQQGWATFVRDNDTEAIRYFELALITAEQENNTADKAQALLYLGISYYGMSYTRGLTYGLRAMDEYKKLEATDSAAAIAGRAKCLQLISTIKARQGKYRESIALSREALTAFLGKADSAGYPGIIYSALGTTYSKLKMYDSAARYFHLALDAHLRVHNLTYLTLAYINMGDLAIANNRKEESLSLYNTALEIADSTANRQAQVLALLGLGEWEFAFKADAKAANTYCTKAQDIAQTLTDKAFLLKAYEQLMDLAVKTGNYKQALVCQQAITATKDSILSGDRQREIRSLEIQFDVSEKERKLKLMQKETEITRLTNYMLSASIAMLALIAAVIIYMLRRINRRDQALLKTKEALVIATEEQKRLAEEQQFLLQEQKKLREQQMQQELEFKESQLSALTLQMLQKNELMQELKERFEGDKHLATDQALNKIINKGLTKDKEWSDFNTYFETVNTQFYTRLKQAYPDISPNDLKLCALIKLHLSIKEMAAILNISPDSVKTARYRLRKKLQLNTEDNLTEFILSL